VGLVTNYRVAQMDLRRVTGTLDVAREFTLEEAPTGESVGALP